MNDLYCYSNEFPDIYSIKYMHPSMLYRIYINLGHSRVYYMIMSILLVTQTLVVLIRHYVWDLSGVFSVWHT